MIEQKLGLLIGNKREELDLSVTRLSEETGISYETLKHYERGNNLKTFVKIMGLLERLEVQWYELEKVIR